MTEFLRAVFDTNAFLSAYLSRNPTSMAEWVNVPAQAIVRAVPGDADDDIVIACAVVGAADFLVTYDPHFESLGGSYRGVKIIKALPFLWTSRGDQPPGKGVGE